MAYNDLVIYSPDMLKPNEVIEIERRGYHWHTLNYMGGCECLDPKCTHKVPMKATILYHPDHWAPAMATEDMHYKYGPFAFKAKTRVALQYAISRGGVK